MIGVRGMQKSILDNRVICFIVNFIHDLFWSFLGLSVLLSIWVSPPKTPGKLYFTIMFAEWGIILLIVVFFTNFNALKFDKVFKKTLLSDDAIFLHFMALSIFPAALIIRIRAVRALMYMRGIVLYKSTQKNPDYHWFHGYDFRKHATWFDKLLAHSISVLLFSSIEFGILSMLTT